MKKITAILLLIALALSLCACGAQDVRARFVTPQDEFELSAERGVLTLPEAEPVEGQVFLGWQNESGTYESGAVLTLAEDSVFTALYAPDLTGDIHPAYLFADHLGRCLPTHSMTHGDAARMFASLTGEGQSSATLVDLGLSEKDPSFRPELELTRGELFIMLAHFFPAAAETHDFADLEAGSELSAACSLAVERGWICCDENGCVIPGRILTRLETARIMNRVLERGGESLGDFEEKAMALRDLPADEESRAEMLEAVVPHECGEKRGRRVWLKAEAPYAQIDGYTSGSWALDRLLAGILAEQLKDERDPAEQRRILYRYVRDSFTYRKGNLYEMGDVSWLEEEAEKLASTGRGNCYSYAALLCELYRAIGLDAEVFSGNIADSPHAWVEAEIDGVRYIYDVEMEYAYLRQRKSIDMFEKTYEEMNRWEYERSPAEDAPADDKETKDDKE